MPLLLTAVLIVLAALPASARAAGWRVTDLPMSRVATDGERWAVAGAVGSEELFVFDDRRPGWRPLAHSAGCAFDGTVGAGRAVLRCFGDYGFATFRLLDLATGVETPVPGVTVGGNLRFGAYASALGRRWAEFTTPDTGAVEYAPLAGGARVRLRGTRFAADLDAADVRQRLCRPVRRPAGARAERDGRWWVMPRGGDVVAWRCGVPRPERIFAAPVAAHQVGAGLVSAGDEPFARLHRLADGKRRRVRTPAGLTTVLHTRRHLFASTTPAGERVAVVRHGL